ncbi:MAG TPA: hypothetical protein VJU61_03240, partial [Polyangiaceae bacterium]|nr:hypothetical protein [Polyangiaceae bacterium]
MELPDLTGRAELVRRYARLLQHFGAELGERPLVRHDTRFFPDRFDKDQASLERLVRRLQAHAGLLDVPLRVQLLTPEGLPSEGSAGSCGTGGCGTGACGTSGAADGGPKLPRLEENAQGWTLNVGEAELHHPVALTTQLSLALADIFLTETESASAPVEAPREVSRDLACVALGLGLLVLEGSFIYSKSCGGPSVACLTQLSVGELSIACSLFIASGGHSARRSLADLGTTQRALLSEANDWAASNPQLIQQLTEDPGQLAMHAPSVQDTRGWLLRLFQRGPQRAGTPARRAASFEQALAAGLDESELLDLAQDLAKDRSGGTRPAKDRPASNGAAQPAARASTAPADERRARERRELAALVDEA